MSEHADIDFLSMHFLMENFCEKHIRPLWDVLWEAKQKHIASWLTDG